MPTGRRPPTGKVPHEKPLRLRRRGISPLRAGIIAVLLIALGTYAGFSKHVPFRHGYTLKAVFSSALNIGKNSPVRIAGVDVGTVTGISRYQGSNAALVTMSLSNSALPLHADATLKIRPRIFLEGNFFVALTPGSPSAANLASGSTIPITQTADPVQLDQVLSALNSDTRTNLQELLDSYGTALTHVPTPAENVTQDPSVRGKTAAEALNAASRIAPRSLRNSTIVSQALAGRNENDLSTFVYSLGRVTSALSQNEADLQGLITNFDITLQALARQSTALAQSVGLLPGALTNADHAFVNLDNAFPSIRGFALDLIPATEETPATVAAALPWIAQARQLVSPSQLGDLSVDLAQAAPSLGALTPAQTSLARQLDSFSRCLANTLLPAGNAQLNDGSLSSGGPDYQEFWSALVGLNGAGASFDGNGSFLRALAGGGGIEVTTSPSTSFAGAGTGPSYDERLTEQPLGTSPANPGKTPPIVSSKACGSSALPNFNGPQSHGAADGAAP